MLEGRASHSPSDISGSGLSTTALAKLISMIQGKQEITLLTAPGLFCSSDALGRLAVTLHNRMKAVIPLGAACNSRGAVLRAGFTSSLPSERTIPQSGSFPLCFGEDIFRKIEAGSIRALYILSDDPLENMGNPEKIKKLLGRLDLIIHQSPYRTSVSSFAHIILPSATLPEKHGSVVDLWGVEHVFKPAIALRSGVMTDLTILTKLQNALEKCRPGNPGENFMAAGKLSATASEEPVKQFTRPDFDKKLFPLIMTAVPSLYGNGIISRQSPELLQLKGGLKIIMNDSDLEKLNLNQADVVTIMSPFGKASGQVEASFNLRPGNVLALNVTGNPEALSLLDGKSAVTPVNILKTEAR